MPGPINYEWPIPPIKKPVVKLPKPPGSNTSATVDLHAPLTNFNPNSTFTLPYRYVAGSQPPLDWMSILGTGNPFQLAPGGSGINMWNPFPMPQQPQPSIPNRAFQVYTPPNDNTGGGPQPFYIPPDVLPPPTPAPENYDYAPYQYPPYEYPEPVNYLNNGSQNPYAWMSKLLNWNVNQ